MSEIQVASAAPAALGATYAEGTNSASDRSKKSVQVAKAQKISPISENLHVLHTAQNRPMLEIKVKL